MGDNRDNRDTPQPPSRTDSPSVRTVANSKNANTKAKREVRILMLHGEPTFSSPQKKKKKNLLKTRLTERLG